MGEAEESLRQVLAEVTVTGDAEAEALANHVLAAVLHTQGRPAEAIPFVWRAFELYGDELSRTRALGDLGTMLLMVGDAGGAERAFNELLHRAATEDVRSNALIELMNCASYRRDRVGFERWREQCETRRASMPPNILVDFMLKAGIGRARFGQFNRAEALLVKALEAAESAGLHEFVFRVERVKNGLRECERELATAAEVLETPSLESDAVREVSTSLARLE